VVLDVSIMALMMEAKSTSEKLINFYQTTRRDNPEDSHFHALNMDVRQKATAIQIKLHNMLYNLYLLLNIMAINQGGADGWGI
jgi:hypothetical protein